MTWDGSRLLLGAQRPERVVVAAGADHLAPQVRPGDRAIGHWEWVCDVLRPTQVVALQRTTAQILALTITALTRPVAAVVLD